MFSSALLCTFRHGFSMEASMDPSNVAILFTRSSCFMLTCQNIARHDVMEYINMTT